MVKRFFMAMLVCVVPIATFSGCGRQTNAIENATEDELQSYNEQVAAEEAKMNEEMAGNL